jgi:hypothetical protein
MDDLGRWPDPREGNPSARQMSGPHLESSDDLIGGAEGNRTPDLCSAIAKQAHVFGSLAWGSARVDAEPFRNVRRHRSACDPLKCRIATTHSIKAAGDVNNCLTRRAPVCLYAYKRRTTVSQKLQELLDRSRGRRMSADEQEAQRRSFAYGNAHIENDRVTRAMVDEAAEKLKRS